LSQARKSCLKQTEYFIFPSQSFLLHTDFHADRACRGRRRWEGEQGAGAPPGACGIFPSSAMVEGSTLLAAFLSAK
uniref:Uncharacterized protein n=1 Tax=Falco tinnunculus TaxID=100819 RepID=A0A8C4XPI7_FALTI